MSSNEQQMAEQLRSQVQAAVAELSSRERDAVQLVASSLRDTITGGEMQQPGLGHLALALASIELQQSPSVGAALDTSRPPVGLTVLQEPPADGLTATYRDSHGHRRLTLEKGFDYELGLQTPFCGDPEYEFARPGIWYGTEMRADGQGRRWTAALACKYVTNDFGDLVEVSR